MPSKKKKLETDYQSGLINRIEDLLLGCIILKNDSSYRQGIPDLTILWGPCWAILEVKASEDEPFQPNQEWYLERFNEMSFAACIYPQNEKEVLDALQRSLTVRWQALISQC